MIRTLAVNCTPILDCCQDAGKTVVETASDKIVMGEVWALCEYCLLVSQQNHYDLSLTVLDDALKRFYKKKDAIEDLKMSKSTKSKVDELLARESHQSRIQKISKICAAMTVQLYGAEMVAISE
jgi:hypothetical protein